MSAHSSTLPVLIVDDDEPTQSLLRAVLRRCGHTSEIARDGREAIEKLQAKQYVAVVLDMMMPEVNGRDVIAFLSEMETPVPVIICSAAGPAALAGFDPRVVKAIVRKPFDVDEFLVTVTSVTGSSAS